MDDDIKRLYKVFPEPDNSIKIKKHMLKKINKYIKNKNNNVFVPFINERDKMGHLIESVV